MRADRMIAFTDAVLAIIITILVLGLERPAELSFDGFWELRTSFFAYCLSFFWIGSVWITLNIIWENVEQVSRKIVWWNLVFLFFASFLPYATGLVSLNFDDRFAQAFYGIIVITTTTCNLILHKLIDSPNSDNSDLLDTTKAYRRLLLPDIFIKIISLVLALTVYPPIMMYGVLTAAGYFQLAKIIFLKRKKFT